MIRVLVAGTERGGLLKVRVVEGDRGVARDWLMRHFEKKGAAERVYEMSLKPYYRPRTIDQNKLLRALEAVLAYEAYREWGWESHVHEELLLKYSPRMPGKIAGDVPKRSSACSTVEFSRIVEGAFKEIAERGVEVTEPEQIGRYWREWNNWRSTQGVDPLLQTYKDLEDYRRRQVFCEACTQKYIGEGGTMAHIVSKGAGGSDEPWNRMKLCDDCHLHTQHRAGWEELIEQHPHIGWRVAKARERSGVPSIEVPALKDDLVDARPIAAVVTDVHDELPAPNGGNGNAHAQEIEGATPAGNGGEREAGDGGTDGQEPDGPGHRPAGEERELLPQASPRVL